MASHNFHVFLLLAWGVCGLVCADPAHSASSYALVADAGSTATRLYLFRLENGLQSDAEVHRTLVGGKGPALSSFATNPDRAAETVRAQLEEAKSLIPVEQHSSVPVSVFATAGLRLLSPETQEKLFQGVVVGVTKAGFAFDTSKLQARTISGREEGTFALIAANYLSKKLSLSLQAAEDHLVGVLDLGGSSTQVAVPPTSVEAGEHLGPKFADVQQTFVRSFLSLGMERMRQRTFQRFVDEAPAMSRERGAVANPCSFYGYSADGEQWRGVGDARACEETVVKVIRDEMASCSASSSVSADCLGKDSVPTARSFLLISGYLYVTDFARWWLESEWRTQPTPDAIDLAGTMASPTVSEIRAAAIAVCAEPWGNLDAVANHPDRKHKFTGPVKVPHRCFELNYIAALLSVGYGFGKDERIFHVVDEIGGEEVEWTLGAFLHGIVARDSRMTEL